MPPPSFAASPAAGRPAEDDTGPVPFASKAGPGEGRLALERLELLRDIVGVSQRAATLSGLLQDVVTVMARRYDGIQGALLDRTPHGWQVRFEVPAAAPDFDWPALVSSALPGPITARSGPTVAPGATASVVIPIAGALLEDRALAFIDRVQAVDIPRAVMAEIAADCAYVLQREIEHHRLVEREMHFRAVFDSSPIPQVLMPDGQRDQLIANDAFCELVGRTRAELTGPHAVSVTHPDEISDVTAARRVAAADPSGQYRMSRRLVHSSGEIVYTQSVLNWVVLPTGGRTLLMQFQDVTAQRQAELDLMRQTETDSLTGIGNRLKLVRWIAEFAEAGEDFGVVFLDVDHFKLINDTRGHDVGDEILRAIASRLTLVAGADDVVVRFGGDEFVVLCRSTGPAGPEEGSAISVAVHSLANRVHRVLAEPIQTATGAVHVTVSIGICDDTIPVARPLDRLQYADTAAYRAKRLGEDRQVLYDTGLHRESVEYRRVESLLRTALEEGRFVMHYQPIVDLADGRPTGVEALVRMRDRDGKLVPPGEFIEVAERSGLIVPMGAWVLAESCRSIAALHRSAGVPLRVSVNVAARQASRPDLVTAVYRALEQAEMPPDALTLELTESALLEADASTLDRLNELRESGIQIALDDFGTGYSSLVYLRQLPVSLIKVDQSFVGTMTTDPGSAAIVRAVTTLAGDLGLSWVAEGVETMEQWQALRELGEGRAQGYYFSRPQPADALVEAVAATPGR